MLGFVVKISPFFLLVYVVKILCLVLDIAHQYPVFFGRGIRCRGIVVAQHITHTYQSRGIQPGKGRIRHRLGQRLQRIRIGDYGGGYGIRPVPCRTDSR